MAVSAYHDKVDLPLGLQFRHPIPDLRNDTVPTEGRFCCLRGPRNTHVTQYPGLPGSWQGTQLFGCPGWVSSLGAQRLLKRHVSTEDRRWIWERYGTAYRAIYTMYDARHRLSRHVRVLHSAAEEVRMMQCVHCEWSKPSA